MALARSQREWAILIGEYNIVKKKLESKREALKIMKKEWQSVQRERDIYKNKINQLQQDLDDYAKREKCQKQASLQKEAMMMKEEQTQREISEKQRQQVQKKEVMMKKELSKPAQQQTRKLAPSPDLLISSSSRDSLAQLVFEYKEINKALRKDLFELKKLYMESQEDVQILRDRMRKSSGSSSISDESSSPSCLTDCSKEEFIAQLEEYKGQVASLEQELKSIKDESSDVTLERNHYKEKCERLNTQLNYILGADDRRLVDVDALVLDNKYLKEKLVQLEEQRDREKESIQKYEAAFERKKNSLLYRGHIGDRMASYHSRGTEHSSKTIGDLRNVANILSETITEKNLALSHQRNANRILGKRVSELENKLKTLEVAGLWSLPGHRGYGSISLKGNAQEPASSVGGSTAVGTERLEWDDSVGLVELSDAEKAEFLERISLENSKSSEGDITPRTPDLISKLDTCQGSSHGNASDDVTHSNGYQGCGLENGKAINRTKHVEETGLETTEINTPHQTSPSSYGAFNDSPKTQETPTFRRLSRALSAPTLFSESFDENENVNDGGNFDEFGGK